MLISYSFPPLTVDLPELTLIGLGKHLLPGIAMTRIFHALILLCWYWYCWWTKYISWYDRYPLNQGVSIHWNPVVLLFHMVQNFLHQTVGMSQNEGPPQVQNSRIFLGPMQRFPCPSIPGVWDRHPLGPCPKVCKAQMFFSHGQTTELNEFQAILCKETFENTVEALLRRVLWSLFADHFSSSTLFPC